MEALDEIFRAVGNSDASRVRELLRQHPELGRARNASTLSLVRFAKYIGDGAILDMLIAAGPPLDVFEAAMIDDAKQITRLVGTDASLATAFSDDGFTAAHFAAYFGSTEALRALLDAGATTSAVTHNFLANMPLHAGAAGGHVDAMTLLLERGADANAPQHSGFLPLHIAAFHESRDMADLLLQHGADASLTNDDGKTPADVAAERGGMEIAAYLRSKMH